VRRRTWVVVAAAVLAVTVLAGWQWSGRQDSLVAGSALMSPSGARLANDGVADTRYVFAGKPGNRLRVLATFRNEGRFPVVVRPPARSPSGGLIERWITAGYVGHSPDCNGCNPLDPSAANRSSVRLKPGEEGLLMLDLQVGPCPVAEPGAISDIESFKLPTTTLGIDAVEHVDLLRLPLTVTGWGPNTEPAPGC
jgi:hypothetical protein